MADLKTPANDVDPFEELPEGDGVLILSPQKLILSANLQAERLLRIKLNRGQSLPLELLVNGKNLPQAELAFKEALQNGTSSSNLLAQFGLAPDDTVYLNYSIDPLYNHTDNIIGAILTLRDNTTARAWTAWSAEGLGIEFDAMFDNLAEAVFIINKRWRITGFNRRAEDLTGFKRQQVLGRYCWDIFKGDHCQTDCPLKATLTDGVTRTDQDVRMLNSGGRALNVLVNTSIIRDKKGAVAGAIASKVGRFELAKGGTLFLDEIGEFKPELQVKLLRVLEERVFWRVGGTQPIPIDIRIIVATSRNLKEEVRQGRFREDLYYRLRTVPLWLPPLRERLEDIPLLVNHFIHHLNRKFHKEVRGLDPKVLVLFQQYNWPGNVRELQHVLEHAFVFVKGHIIGQRHLPEWEDSPQKPHPLPAGVSPTPSLWEDERDTIQKALRKARGRRQVAASLLGISRSSLWRKMREHNLT